MGKSVAQIVEIFSKIDPQLSVTEDAAEAMTAIPGMFVKMAAKKTAKRARQEGIAEIDLEFANKMKGENFPGK